jgi:hypothetical protein
VLESLVRVYERVAGELPVSTSARSLARRRAEVMRAELAAVQGASGIDALWRRRVRPALAHAKNRALRKEGWLDQPPREVAEAFPHLIAGKAP